MPLQIRVPAHLLQMTTQRLMDAQSGLGEPQSAQKRLDSTAQILSATSELERASAMDCCMASTHSSFSCSESAEKLPTGMAVRYTVAWGGQHPQHPLLTLGSPEDPVWCGEVKAPAIHLLDVPHIHLDVGDANPQLIVLVGVDGQGMKGDGRWDPMPGSWGNCVSSLPSSHPGGTSGTADSGAATVGVMLLGDPKTQSQQRERGLHLRGQHPVASVLSPFEGWQAWVPWLTAALLRLGVQREQLPLEIASGSPIMPQSPQLPTSAFL